jgi:hypothetical protein
MPAPCSRARALSIITSSFAGLSNERSAEELSWSARAFPLAHMPIILTRKEAAIIDYRKRGNDHALAVRTELETTPNHYDSEYNGGAMPAKTDILLTHAAPRFGAQPAPNAPLPCSLVATGIDSLREEG